MNRKIVLLKAISDNQVGSWTGGQGGTSNLFDAVNNIPPIGTSSETNLTQIENVTSGGGTNYIANMTTYTNAGIIASDIIKLVHGVVDHAEDASSGTKTGQFKIASNPVGSFTIFTFGDNAGALAAWPGNWRATWGSVEYNPSTTLGNSPTVELDRTDANSTVGSVDFVGIMVEYTNAVADSLVIARNIFKSSVFHKRIAPIC
jgi:hypothetical protein